jgi:hypothetical protein
MNVGYSDMAMRSWCWAGLPVELQPLVVILSICERKSLLTADLMFVLR